MPEIYFPSRKPNGCKKGLDTFLLKVRDGRLVDCGKASTRVVEGREVSRKIGNIKKQVAEEDRLACKQPIHRLCVEAIRSTACEIKCASLQIAVSAEAVAP